MNYTGTCELDGRFRRDFSSLIAASAHARIREEDSKDSAEPAGGAWLRKWIGGDSLARWAVTVALDAATYNPTMLAFPTATRYVAIKRSASAISDPEWILREFEFWDGAGEAVEQLIRGLGGEISRAQAAMLPMELSSEQREEWARQLAASQRP